MILKDIHIENFKAYKSFDCEFERGMNLIIGDNGSGKTSLLDAIVCLLNAELNDFGLMMYINVDFAHKAVKKTGDATFDIKEEFPIVVTGNVESNNKSEQIGHRIEGRERSYSFQEGKLLSKTFNQEAGMASILNYQRFDRKWKPELNQKRLVTVDTGLTQRSEGYEGCLSGNGLEDKIQRWCLKMSMLQFERKTKIKEFETFKKIIQKFMQTMEGRNSRFEIDYSVEYSGLILREDKTIAPLYELSTGYNVLLSMIMEMAYRAVLLNPNIDAELSDLEGIVVIDEIDAHLHPKWQWRIIDALEKCFPGVQFIVATHSPIVISSAKNARIISLRGEDGFCYEESAYGFSVEDVLALRQGSATMPAISAEYMEKLERALDEGSLEKAEQVLRGAKEQFGEKSAFYRELEQYYTINRWVEVV